mmetsp:Transcript_7814/g.13788  ORF Transcript_7814/g.13788 Transcript_7814/m.13788 type:complete len:130 (-) Transcript_7814:1041-1430(-)
MRLQDSSKLQSPICLREAAFWNAPKSCRPTRCTTHGSLCSISLAEVLEDTTPRTRVSLRYSVLEERERERESKLKKSNPRRQVLQIFPSRVHSGAFVSLACKLTEVFQNESLESNSVEGGGSRASDHLA